MYERQSWKKYAFITYNIIPSPIDFNYYNNELSLLKNNSAVYKKFIDYLINYNLQIIESNN